MSAQRGKKTRSAASRYRRYVRLTSATVELRLQLIKCQSKKEKERHAKRVIRAVGRSASTHTASPPLPSLRLGFAQPRLHERSTSFLKSGASRVKWACLLANVRQTHTQYRKALVNLSAQLRTLG